MRNFLKLVFLLIYFLSAFFIKPIEVFANTQEVFYNPPEYYVSATQTKMDLLEETENYYAVLQNNIIQISQNKENNQSNISAGNECLLADNSFNIYISGAKLIKFNRIEHNTSQNLKYAINTRAP